MHHVHYKSAPQYLSDSVQSVATASCNGRTGLRSADTANYVKRCTRTKFGERAFSFAGPSAWNNLYLRTCNTALTLMYSRKGLRHFCSKVHSSQIDFILVFMYFSIVSAPGHFCIATLYKFSVYCIVLLSEEQTRINEVWGKLRHPKRCLVFIQAPFGVA